MSSYDSLLFILQLKSYMWDFKVSPKPLIHPCFQWLRVEGSSLASSLSLAHTSLMMEGGAGMIKVETLFWVAQEEIIYVSLWLLSMDTVLTRW